MSATPSSAIWTVDHDWVGSSRGVEITVYPYLWNPTPNQFAGFRKDIGHATYS